jgi:hypothetical protein
MPGDYLSLLIGGRTASTVRRSTVAVLALCALSLAKPSAVRAECGDYVMLGNRHAASSSGANETQRGAMHHSQKPKLPCHGPHCSRGTPAPAVPIAGAPAPAQEWGCIAKIAFVFANRATTPWREAFDSFPRSYVSSIFHPPRANSSSIL